MIKYAQLLIRRLNFGNIIVDYKILTHIHKQNLIILRSMIGLPNLLDKFIDITGHEIDWHDREDGWTEDRRKKIWSHNLSMIDQLKKLPAFTKSGYKKMSIPTELYKLILQILKQNSTKYIVEELNDHHFLSNWQRIYPDGSKGDKSCKNPCYMLHDFTK